MLDREVAEHAVEVGRVRVRAGGLATDAVLSESYAPDPRFRLHGLPSCRPLVARSK